MGKHKRDKSPKHKKKKKHSSRREYSSDSSDNEKKISFEDEFQKLKEERR